MNNDDELKALLGGDGDILDPPNEDSPHEDRISKGLKRTRTNLAQQQTLSFMLIKIWVSVAKILAPFFAVVAKRQAEARAKPSVSGRSKEP